MKDLDGDYDDDTGQRKHDEDDDDHDDDHDNDPGDDVGAADDDDDDDDDVIHVWLLLVMMIMLIKRVPKRCVPEHLRLQIPTGTLRLHPALVVSNTCFAQLASEFIDSWRGDVKQECVSRVSTTILP